MPRFPSHASSVLRSLLFLITLVALGNCYGVRAQAPTSEAGEIVFSQIYTRGGNPGSIYKNNYIALFKRSDHTIDI